MRVVFVLGSLNALMAWKLAALNIDAIYYFSASELILPEFPIACYRLSSPQIDALKESYIIENCIERNIMRIASMGDDTELMRRALRLSELRVEARCYLNAIAYLQDKLMFAGKDIEAVIFSSHYITSEDVWPLAGLNVFWYHMLHSRFLGLVPGLSRLNFLIQVLGVENASSVRNLKR